jgi:hypothetical protein
VAAACVVVACSTFTSTPADTSDGGASDANAADASACGLLGESFDTAMPAGWFPNGGATSGKEVDSRRCLEAVSKNGADVSVAHSFLALPPKFAITFALSLDLVPAVGVAVTVLRLECPAATLEVLFDPAPSNGLSISVYPFASGANYSSIQGFPVDGTWRTLRIDFDDPNATLSVGGSTATVSAAMPFTGRDCKLQLGAADTTPASTATARFDDFCAQ